MKGSNAMHSTRIVLLGAVLAVTVGALGGMFSAPRAESSHQRELWIYPGDQSNDWAYMTCGWHVECVYPYTVGNGIDWGNQADWPVIWRSWSYRPGSYGYFGTGVPFQNNGNCKAVRVEFYDENGLNRGYVRYVHSESPTSQFYLNADPDWEAHAIQAATTASEDLVTCTTTGAHLHQEVGSGWTKNTGYPNAPNAGWHQVWVDWMHYRLW